jgi:hypothetical protein
VLSVDFAIALHGTGSLDEIESHLRDAEQWLETAVDAREWPEAPAAETGLERGRSVRRGGRVVASEEGILFIRELVEMGKLKPVIDRSYPIEPGFPIAVGSVLSLITIQIGRPGPAYLDTMGKYTVSPFEPAENST